MKYWEANIEGIIFTAPTLKALALMLKIKPSLIEGVYYRKRLSKSIIIKKITIIDEVPVFKISHEPFLISFD